MSNTLKMSTWGHICCMCERERVNCRPVIRSSLREPVYVCDCRHGFIIYHHFSCLHRNLGSFLINPFLSSSPHSWPVPQLEPSQIRLIVYQDCERRGRNVLFDSSTMKRGPEETPVPVSHAFTSLCSTERSGHLCIWAQISIRCYLYTVAPFIVITCRGFTDPESVPPDREKLPVNRGSRWACKGGYTRGKTDNSDMFCFFRFETYHNWLKCGGARSGRFLIFLSWRSSSLP